MLDQSFSPENLRQILDMENRKGVNVAQRLSLSQIAAYERRIRDCNREIARARSVQGQQIPEALHEKKRRLHEQRDQAIQETLLKISDKITSRSFKIDLRKDTVGAAKPVYTMNHSPSSYFAVKQAQRNIRALFDVKQANRDAIVEQLSSILADGFPKYVIRTDIREFYETIAQRPILEKMQKDTLVSPTTRKIITQVLYGYRRFTNTEIGLPRGVGLSAYLAELYMRDVDQHIERVAGLLYYGRYVDDMVLAFAPTDGRDEKSCLKELEEVLKGYGNGLELNQSKTKLIDVTETSSQGNFECLGYNFQFGNGSFVVTMSQARKDRYRERIKASIHEYCQQSAEGEKDARRLLAKRIRFLSSNTRLVNNKGRVMVGMYYSNRHVNTDKDFKDLDKFLKRLLKEVAMPTSARSRIGKYSFLCGFRDRKHSPFSPADLVQIVRAWKERY